MSANPAKALGDASAFHAIFFEEADEHLASVESLLLRLDPGAPDAEALNGIFRAVHSIKGSAGMLGFAEIVSLTHVFENLLDLLRKGERALARPEVDAMLRAGDVVKSQIAFRRGSLPQAPDMRGAEADLRELANASTPAAPRKFSVRLGPLASPIDAAELEMMLAGLADMGELGERAIDNIAGGEVRFELSLTGAEADLRSVLALVVDPTLITIGKVAEAKPPVNDESLELFEAPAAFRARRGESRRKSEGRREADRSAPAPQGDASSIRVSVEKIDRLVNLVGELVITEAMLAQEHGSLPDLSRHTRDLQEAVMAIRMVPISAVFSRFPRLVRELAQRLGKEVEIKTSGEGTELDRGMIEKITDPLTHLVRNAVDHGMEAPEARIAAGKPRAGTVSITASQRGGSIVIEVRDDGRGLDRNRILARAAERGMNVPEGASDREVWQLVFEAGFSTAEAVTEVSGRGVGMDVVRRNIQSLGGTVELASTAGAGTTVTVSVPLTLAIIEAMTVGVAGKTYVLPLASVVESRRVGRDELRGIAGHGSTLRVRDDYLPVRRMGESGEIAVIVESESGRAALMVDELIGQQQVVVKSLESNFRRIPGLSGATIMGDGSVALILDVAHIVSHQGDAKCKPLPTLQ
ncbi:MAG TPA: chemotaxis protein CheW [Burkholderiales bacterium]|nr:chemotaxis protein CheW [Burkholderiales bacterium]